MPRSLTNEHLATPVTSSPLPWQAEPAEVFKRLSQMPGAVFLDSSDSSFTDRSQWSFLSAHPQTTICFNDGELTVDGGTNLDQSKYRHLGPFEALRSFINACESESKQDSYTQKGPFPSMVIGYIGYEMGRFIERLPKRPKPTVPHPEMWFGYYPTVLAFRHSDASWWLCGAEGHSDELDIYQVMARASTVNGMGRGVGAVTPVLGGEVTFTPNVSDYLAGVEQILERIKVGDLYQANLARQVEASFESVDPVGLYMRLRSENPAPFSAALKLDRNGPWILSSSPERFLRVKNRKVETHPIKGTTPRSKDPLIDRDNRDQLMRSIKDAAELSMIVDVLRNDLGRVCDYGSVRLHEHRRLERYARVHHLVSTVTGRLSEGIDVVDLLEATFPGGSITGAPKIKAMECLAELEPFGRGVYTGAIGYFGLDGSADFNIAIRTMVLSDNRACFGIGGGVVADSDPEAELKETLYKGSALMDALGENGELWASHI